MRRLSADDFSKLLILLALILGGWLRFWPVLQAGFPLNDGGMFYSMIEDLYANHFLLPQFTSYNAFAIPYAYPPLAFYLGAALKALGIAPLQTLMFVPPLLSSVAIGAFAGLARAIFPDSWGKTGWSTLAFALTPGGYTWFIMGGGLTRSLGQIFLLLTLTAALRLYRRGGAKNIWLSGILGSLTLLSHPEAGWHAAISAVVLFLFLGRTKKNFINGLQVGGIVWLLSAPWWGSVIFQNGFAIFINAFFTGGYAIYRVLNAFLFAFPKERLAAVVTVLGMFGLLRQLARKEFFLPAWLVIPFLAEPRSAPAVSLYPLIFLSAQALFDVFLPALKKNNEVRAFTVRKTTVFAIGFLTLYLVFASALHDLEIMSNFVPAASREAMQWARQQTPPTAVFIVLTGPADPMTDSAAEWFPALTARHNLTTLQGREWTLGSAFLDAFDAYDAIQQCYYQDAACLERQAQKLGFAADYLYLDYRQVSAISDGLWRTPPLFTSLQDSGKYELLYQNSAAAIFRRKENSAP